ncbi:MAG: hypothetical protein Tsb007_33360 [Rhizobacter sp.]
MRPAYSDDTTGAAANKPSNTPTAQVGWPLCKASKGPATRTPAMHECRQIWPMIKASRGREKRDMSGVGLQQIAG